MSDDRILIGLIAVIVPIAWARLLLWWRAAAPQARSRGWRIGALIVLQPLWAGLLLLTLLPPRGHASAGALTVLTADWRTAAMPTGGARIALLEADAPAGTEAAPDLATALRRHPGTSALDIVGAGLTARDRPAAAGLPLRFAAATAPSGLTWLGPPDPVAPGADFHVRGHAARDTGSVELVDPAGRRVDAQALPASGDFDLVGAVRAPGAAQFGVKLRDAGGALREAADVPVRTVSVTPPRLLLIGAPGPEIKYLRRWASDAGMPVEMRLSAGGGTILGDAAASLNTGILQRFDLAIVDDRGWATLGGGEQAALLAATRSGMGLLLRATGPLPDGVARDWRGFGFGLGGGALAPLRLPREALDAPALIARRGPGRAEVPATLNAGQNDAPVLTRSALRIAAPDNVPLSAEGWAAPLGRWRAIGRGRAGVWLLVDSFGLQLAGQGERYGAIWGALVAALARAQGGVEPLISPLPIAGQRIAICGLAGPARVATAAGRSAALLADPVAGGCAGFWPEGAGWHMLMQPGAATPFYVWPAAQLAGVRADALREATLAMVNDRPIAHGALRPGERGSPWPWFLGLLVVSGALWWLERARAGRAAVQGTD